MSAWYFAHAWFGVYASPGVCRRSPGFQVCELYMITWSRLVLSPCCQGELPGNLYLLYLCIDVTLACQL